MIKMRVNETPGRADSTSTGSVCFVGLLPCGDVRGRVVDAVHAPACVRVRARVVYARAVKY